MYPPNDTDSSELTEARVEIQQFLGTWLRQPWLPIAHAKHLLFFVSLVLFALKSRHSFITEMEFKARVQQAYADARRLYHTSPNEMFEAIMAPPEDDDDYGDYDDDDGDGEDDDTPKN